MEWAIENRERICRGFIEQDEQLARVRQILFGGPPEQSERIGSKEQDET